MFSIPQWEIITSDQDRTLFLSGKGGGKTHTMGSVSSQFVQNVPQVLGLIAANTYGQLADSTLLEVFTFWKKYCGWEEWSTANPSGVYVVDKQPPTHFTPHGYTFKSNTNKIFFENGAVIMLASLDNWKAIDGRTIGWALLDETKDTREMAVKEVIISRLRQMGICRVRRDVPLDDVKFRFCHKDHQHAGEPANPLMIFTAPSKEQWLTEFFHLDEHEQEIEGTIYSETGYYVSVEDNRKVVISSTYHNQANLPPNYIYNLKNDLSADQQKLQIYGSPFGKAGNEYYSDYTSAKHIRECVVLEGYPLHLTIDFNVNPYMSGQVWQIVPGHATDDGRTKVRCIAEYALRNPRNTIEDVCEDFDYDYGHLAMKYGFFYYGDATGKNTLPIKDQRNLFASIEKSLRRLISPSSKRLLRQNVRHRAVGKSTMGRRDFMNKCLRGGYGFDVEIDPSCKHTNLDFQHIKEDANGAKLKEKVKDDNKVTYEKYGHMSDAADAFFAYVYGDYARDR